MYEHEDSNDSDYVVEQYIRPDITKVLINDESADILGNFDNSKRNKDGDLLDLDRNDDEEKNNYGSDETSDAVIDYGSDDEKDSDTEGALKNGITDDQINNLLRGVKKSSRYVLYVTNLSYDTTKEHLEELFSQAGSVKGIRIPKKRRNSFAFVEMSTINCLKKALQLHNTELNGRLIKIQLSEGGKKKSANKKNILKQKNRKLADMRNEYKCFTKSGKNYDKNIKKEKLKQSLERTRWRKVKYSKSVHSKTKS